MHGASVLAVRHVYMVKKRCNVCRRPRLRGRDRRGRLWAAEALARTGIGAITLIDMDDVCVTNTNRQIHALSGNVGLAKAEVMAERIRLINPECRVTVVDDFVTLKTWRNILASALAMLSTLSIASGRKRRLSLVSPLQGAAGDYRRGGRSD